jgi:hypothetical protein
MVKTNEENKKKLGFNVVNLDGYNPTLPVENLTSFGYVRWGKNNLYPNYLYDIYTNSGTLQSILDGTADFVNGDGIINRTNFQGKNRKKLTLVKTIRKIVQDRMVYGGCACYVIYNELSEVVEIEYIDFRKIRVNANKTKAYIRDKWRGAISTEHEYDIYDSSRIPKSKICVYYNEGNKTNGVYPVPDYVAALISAETQYKIQTFNFNEISNNFLSSKIFNFNNGDPGETQRNEIQNTLEDKFCGVNNAGSILALFNESIDKAATVLNLGTDDLDKRYINLSESVRENLFISMRANPVLFGLPVSTGFADQNYEEAFKLYNRTAVKPIQDEIKEMIEDIFGLGTFDFIPFNLEINIDENTVPDYSNIPDPLLSDLTTNERREIIGYEPLNDEMSDKVVLADTLGVGGTQSLVDIINNIELSNQSKRGLLKVLFGLTDEEILLILPLNTSI